MSAALDWDAYAQADRVPREGLGCVCPRMLKLAQKCLHNGDLPNALVYLGRNPAPFFVREWLQAGLISIQQVSSVLLDLWSGAEFPAHMLPRHQWLYWFRTAGFLSDAGTQRPTEPLSLYRAQVGRVLGMSWTTDRDSAMFFHRRNVKWGGRNARVIHRWVAPSALLAHITDRHEHEFVIDPTVKAVRK